MIDADPNRIDVLPPICTTERSPRSATPATLDTSSLSTRLSKSAMTVVAPARREHEPVGIGTAGQPIIAVAAFDPVIAGVAAYRVGPDAAAQHIAADPASERIIAEIAPKSRWHRLPATYRFPHCRRTVTRLIDADERGPRER